MTTNSKVQLADIEFDPQRVGAFLVTVAGVCLALQCYYLVTIPPASGYEISVFTAYPPTYYIAFAAVVVIALALFLLAGLADTCHWRHATALLATDYGLFFALPLFRNYQLYGRGAADKLVHLADVATIVETGHFEHLIYPLQHVFLAEVVVVSGLPREVVSYLFPYVATMIYILSVGVVVRYFADRRVGLTIGLFVATPLLFTSFHLSINPSIMSFLFVPTYLWLVERYRRLRTQRTFVLLMLFGFSFVLFHPMTIMLVVLVVASTVVFVRSFRSITANPTRRLSPLLPIPLLIAAFVWNLSPYGPRGLIQAMILVWLSGGRSVGANEISRAAEIPFTFWQLVRQFISLYGAIFIYLTAAGLIALTVVYHLYRNRDRLDYARTFLSFQFGVGFFVAITFLSVYFIASNPIRISRYMITMAVLLVGVFLTRSLAVRTRRRRVVVGLLVIGVIASALLAAGTTYRPNYQMTETEAVGTEFVLRHHDDSLPIRTYSSSAKMQQYLLRPDYLADPTPAIRNEDSSYVLWDALGYDENATAAQSFGPSYLITKQYDLRFYESETFTPAQREEVFVYNRSHVRQLWWDTTVQKGYTNGGLKAWRVRAATANRSVATARRDTRRQ